MLSLENSQGGTDKAIGYVWEIGSVVLYAVYEVFYKKFCCDDNDTFPTANSQRFFGLAGLLTLLTIWPLFFLLDHTGVEPFRWPTREELYYIIIVSLCDTLFNLFLVVTILLTSPLFTSVGTILVIPLGCLVDWYFKRLCFALAQCLANPLGTLTYSSFVDVALAPKAYYGVVMIMFGFAMMVYSEHKEHSKKVKNAENTPILGTG